jgi:hypothetical protein
MDKKQPFTIGGCIVLKEALVKETRIRVYDENTCTEWDYLVCDTDFCGLQGCVDPLSTHYQLPQDWDKAVKAVKDFFAEEKFEEDKWYYGVQGTNECLLKYRHSVKSGIVCSEVYWVIGPTVSTILNHTYSTAYIEKLNLQPANTEQIRFMLRKAAESKGLIGGNKIKPLYANPLVVPTDKTIYRYDISVDELSLNYQTIYEKGKWAKLLQREEIKEEGLVLKGIRLENTSQLTEYIGDLYLTPTHIKQIKEHLI